MAPFTTPPNLRHSLPLYEHGRAPLGDPSGRAGVLDEEAEEPPPGTAEGPGDPTPERSEVPA